MDVINIKRFYCSHCGYDQLQKKGKTRDGRQRFKCNQCLRNSIDGCLKKGEKLFDETKLLPVMKKDPVNFNKEELYSLGLLIADGSIDSQNRMTISLQYKDGYILNYIKNALEISNSVKQYKSVKSSTSTTFTKVDTPYCRLTWGYKYSIPYWEKLGMIYKKTGNEVWLPYMNSFHFVRGFLDGDGCISGNKIIFTCASLDFLQNLQKFIEPNINNLGCMWKNRSAFALQYSGCYAKELCFYLYKDSEGLRLERKYNKYLEILNS